MYSPTVITNMSSTQSKSPISLPLSPFSLPSRQNQQLKIQKQYAQPTPPLTTTTTTTPTLPASSWIEIIRSHARSNLFREALSTYIDMTVDGIPPDNFAFPAVLKAVAGLQDLNSGRQIHAAVVKSGYHSSSVTVTNTLLNMYGKCGEGVGESLKVFDRIPQRDQVSWNSMVSALCGFEEWDLALEAFKCMQLEGMEPSSFTMVSVSLVCSHLDGRDGLRFGKQVHGYGLRSGFYCDGRTFTSNALMAMYAKLGRVDDSYIVFERFDNRDMVSWNTMISSLSQNDRFLDALDLFHRMMLAGVKSDEVSIASVLPACSHMKLLDSGKEIHAYALRNDNLFENSYVGSALVDMYCNCGLVESGQQVFKEISERRIGLWNAMITGYTQNGHDKEALRLFIEMEEVAGLSPNPTTMSSVLPACVRCEEFSCKEGIHGYVAKRGFEGDRYVQNALMDMYSRVGKVDVSRKIFNKMDARDIVSWNTMITGFVISGHHDHALHLLSEMQKVRKEKEEKNNDEDGEVSLCRPNSITLMTILPACAALAALAKGKEIHAYAIRNALVAEVTVGSALVDMYAKCGCLNISRKVFDEMPQRNVITWNVLLMAYGMHGLGHEALNLFEYMVSEQHKEGGVKPNEVTFIALFAGCSHSGLVKQGLDLFYKMEEDHSIVPTPDHYACVVDLLGRAGQLEEAYQLITTMSSGPHQAGAWSSLLGACRLHQEVKLGEIAAKQLFHIEPDVASHYVLLSNIYASVGLWSEATEVRKNMKEMGVRKEPGCSWIEAGDGVHKFTAGDSLHPQSMQIYELLKRLSEKMKKDGYVPDTSCVLHNVDEGEKEYLLCGHSERLAIAFGLLNTSPGSTIRIAKNLRVCNDCHVATKFISKIEGREIVVRDVRRFHHFKDGSCSCGDYW